MLTSRGPWRGRCPSARLDATAWCRPWSTARGEARAMSDALSSPYVDLLSGRSDLETSHHGRRRRFLRRYRAGSQRGVRSSLDANPREAIAYIAALAQSLGECLAALGAPLGDIDNLLDSWDEEFAGVPPAVRAWVTHYLTIGHQITAGTDEAMMPHSRPPRPVRPGDRRRRPRR